MKGFLILSYLRPADSLNHMARKLRAGDLAVVAVLGGISGSSQSGPEPVKVFHGGEVIPPVVLHRAKTLMITGRSYRVKDSLPPALEGKKVKKSNEPSTAGGPS